MNDKPPKNEKKQQEKEDKEQQKYYLKNEPILKLSQNPTLKEWINDIQKTYQQHNANKNNLYHDLLHVHIEKARKHYTYTRQAYKQKIHELFKDTKPEKGVLDPAPQEDKKDLLQWKKQNLENTLRADLNNKERKQRISHILTAEFIDRYNPKTLSRENDQRMFYYKNGVYHEGGRNKIQEHVVRRVGEEYAQNIMNLVVQKVEGYTYLWKQQEEDFFDIDPQRICLENGVLNLETQELEPHTPKKIFFEKLPVRYDENQQYKEIEEFVETLVEKDEDKKTIQEMFGYCLLRKYKYKKAFILHGNKNNGKSSILDLLNQLLGKDNVSNVKLQDLGKRFQKRWIVNKLANIVADIPNTSLTETADFKGLTGQDMMMYEVKGGGAFSFKNYAKLIYSANELPRVEDASDAFFERWVLIDFPYEFVDKEKYDQLKEEGKDMTYYKVAQKDAVEKLLETQSLSGILNWALEGLQRLEKQERFTQDREVQVEWVAKSDSFKAFCMELLEDTGTEYVVQEHLEDVYSWWCNQTKNTINSNKRYWRDVLTSEYGAIKQRPRIDGDKKYVWTGIKFKEEAQNYDTLDQDASFYKHYLENTQTHNKQKEEETIETLRESLRTNTEVGEKYHLETLAERTGRDQETIKKWISENTMFSAVDKSGHTMRINQ